MFKRKELVSRRVPMRQSHAELDRTAFQPRPPSASRRTFVRKHQSAMNCHTPDEGGGDPALLSRTNLNQSTSPMLIVKDRTASPFNCENSPVKPNETRRFIRKQETQNLINTRPQLKKVDLKKGSFSAKQIVGGKSNEVSVNDWVLSELKNSRDKTSKRSASPSFNSRNSKFYKLSRVFKLNKAVLGCTSTRQKRTLSDSFKPEDLNLHSIAATPEPKTVIPSQQLLADLNELTRPIGNYHRRRVLRM